MAKKRFNIRVYGIAVYEKHVLLADEHFKGKSFTKFPGGGLEWGEGPEDCLVREFKEELGITVEPSFLFHVTSGFVQSIFFQEDQVVALYYLVYSKEFKKIYCKGGFQEIVPVEESFKWVPLAGLEPHALTFKSDREAARKLTIGEKQPFIPVNREA
jgi:8-oxo-dGTP diphosphatase